jgi:hypothetical protein
MLAEEENFGGLARINRELIGKAEALDSAQRVVLDMDSTEIPVYGEQETGGRLVKHARYYWLMPAESHLTRRLFGSMVRRIDALAVATGCAEERRHQEIRHTRWGRRGACGNH